MGNALACFVAVVVLSGIGMVLALALPSRRIPTLIAVVGPLVAAGLLALGATALLGKTVESAELWNIPAVGSLLFRADPVSGLFLLVTGLVVLPASIFTANSLAGLGARYSLRGYGVMYFALLASITWLLLAGDVFSFLLAWEGMSILSYLLVTFQHEQEEHRRAGYQMLAVSEAGALAALLGLLVLASNAGSLTFDAIRAAAPSLGPSLALTVFLLTFFGFGVKAGLVPVNWWLPRAYHAAPSPFVPVLAGATLNLGLYGILRVNADLLPAVSRVPGVVALVVGTISALVGILYATTENDLKTLLAHSSIENAGIVTVGFGAGFLFTASGEQVLAAVAFLVGLYHLVNHSLYKTLLFIGAGVVEDRAGTRDLDRLGGLLRRMPWTGLAMLAGVLSIAGLPPFNGFVSEWLTLQTLLRSAQLSSVGVKLVFALSGAGLALTAALAVTCFVKLFAMGFLGMTRSPEAEAAGETSRSALGPMGFLAILCLLLGVFPTYVIGVLDHAVRPLADGGAAPALVPPFFAESPGHAALPPAFLQEFHDLGAQVGDGILPGPGLVILHRGGTANPVVFAGAPTYLIVVLTGLLGAVFFVVWLTVGRKRAVERRRCWDGGIRRLLPEMTYTATGFSNPVRVVFQAVFRPTIVEDTRETVAVHFRTAIRRESETTYIVERLLVNPAKAAMLWTARLFARMHHGRLNAYLAYGLLSLLAVLTLFAF
ncbi:MAG TPA: proton-conducting transporter membrane subunit [Gemmatimonadales bacterium]|nr:proton-conducting transporter membrane subunit [Gemmatimonadales bacterium]